jgi:hypothetical protein
MLDKQPQTNGHPETRQTGQSPCALPRTVVCQGHGSVRRAVHPPASMVASPDPLP